MWLAYGDPEILDSANNKPYSLRRLGDDLVGWSKLDGQRWSWIFLPFFCFTMYTLRQEVYTWPVIGSIERIDASYVDKLIPSNTVIEVRAQKNIFSADGGLWVTKKGYEDDVSSGYFLFSEKKENLVLRLDNLAHTVYFRASGCREPNSTKCLSRKEPGSNGLALDPFSKRLLLCEHGERRVSRMEIFGSKTVLSSHYQGKRLNSPNDIVISPNFDVVFSDPTDGLKGTDAGAEKSEIGFQGIYRVPKMVLKSLGDKNRSSPYAAVKTEDLRAQENTVLLSKNVSMPHGLAFSKDYKKLYVSNHDPNDAKWYQFDVNWDVDSDEEISSNSGKRKRKKKKKKKKKRKGGSSEYDYTQAEVEASSGFTLSNMKEFYDFASLHKKCLEHFNDEKKCNGLPDGMTIDKHGNLYLTGPGGVHIVRSDGTLVGSIWTGIPMTNVAFGYDLLFLVSADKILRLQSYASPIVSA